MNEHDEDDMSQEITQGGDVVRKRKVGRPAKPLKPDALSIEHIEEAYQELISLQAPRLEVMLEEDTVLNDHNKRLIRLIQIVLCEDLSLISTKNLKRIDTPNGIRSFEIAGLSEDTRKHLRETLKILLDSVKTFGQDPKDVGGDASSNMARLANEIYKGIPGLDKNGKKLTQSGT